MHVHYSPFSLPILRRVDAAVAGGSFAGVAAALSLARRGKRVLLLEPRTYLGREVTSPLRYWLQGDRLPENDLLQAVISSAGVPGPAEIALHPDRLKICLEDLLLDAGVELLYGCQPVGILRNQNGFGGWVLGTKSGRVGIACSLGIDASESSTGLRSAGIRFENAAPSRIYRRTLEFCDAEICTAQDCADQPVVLELPEELQVWQNRLVCHPGCLGAGHWLLECAFELPGISDLASSRIAESEARRRSLRVVTYLFSHLPAFQSARFTASSYDLSGVMTGRMADAGFDISGKVHLPDLDDPLPLKAFAAPIPNLWCLNPAAHLAEDLRERFSDAAFAAEVGYALVDALAEQPLPSSTIRQFSASPLRAESGRFTVREPHAPPRRKAYERVALPALDIPVVQTAGLLVVGGGTSGAAAALAGAGEGLHTILLDANPGPGGTATFGGVDSHWYGRKVGFAARTQALVDAVHRQIHHPAGSLWNLEGKAAALLAEMERLGVQAFFNVLCTGTVMDGSRVCGVVCATPYGPCAFLGEVVIDATGDGDVAYFAGAKMEYGSPRDHTTIWYSLAQFAQPGRTRNNFTSMVNVSDCEDTTRAILAGRRRGGELLDHGAYLAPRESRRIVTDERVTLTGILRGQQWQNVVNIHFSNYDVKGKSETDWVLLGFIPPNLEMEIPYRSLLPMGVENLLAVGKAIGVSHAALPAVRMQADLENLGGAAGVAAALALRAGVSSRQVDIRQLQARLVQEGLLPPEVLSRKIEPRRYSPAEIAALVDNLDAEKPLYTYSDMEMDEVYRGIIPLVEIGALGSAAVPALERALETADGKRRILIAQLLALCGSQSGVPVLVGAIQNALAGETLPPRAPGIRHSDTAPPNQAAMPDVAYLVYTLGMARDRRSLVVWEEVADLLDFSEADLHDPYKAIFYYVDAVCYGAERLADPAAVPILAKIAAHPLLHGQVCRSGFQADFIPERQAMLEIALGRALARCGSPEGYRILTGYLADNRATLALGAHDELVLLSGQDFGEDIPAWERWLAQNQERLVAQPWQSSLD